MKTESFNISFPGTSATEARYVDASTLGTELDGMPIGAVLVLNCLADVDPELTGGGGDAVITVRASAADTLRFRAKGVKNTTSFDVQVTWLEP